MWDVAFQILLQTHMYMIVAHVLIDQSWFLDLEIWVKKMKILLGLNK